MSEKLKPSLRDRLSRAAVPMAVIGVIGLGGSFADIKITSNTIEKEVTRSIPPTASSEELTKARQEITIFDRAIHESIQQGETVIDVPKITNPLKLQQAITVVSEEQERQKQALALSNKLSKNLLIRSIVLLTGSGALVLMGVLHLGRPQENIRKPTETLQQTNSTT